MKNIWSQHHRLADCSEYFGEWEAGKRHGHGTLYLDNGDWYVGGWKNDEWHGQGMYKYDDGLCYDGDYKHGAAYGQGKFFYEDGRQGITKKRRHKKMKC